MKRALVLLVTFVIGSTALAAVDRAERVPPALPLGDFPMQIAGWTGAPQPPFDADTLRILGVDDYLTRAYFDRAHNAVGLYIGYYRSQRQGDTMHSPLNCLPGSGWEPLSNTRISVPVTNAAGDGSSITINRYVVQKGLDRQLVLYWYQAHGRVTASEYWSKFYLVRDAVRLNRTDGAIVRVIAPVLGETADDEAHAERQGIDFVQALFPRLAGFLPS